MDSEHQPDTPATALEVARQAERKARDEQIADEIDLAAKVADAVHRQQPPDD